MRKSENDEEREKGEESEKRGEGEKRSTGIEKRKCGSGNVEVKWEVDKGNRKK